MTAEWTEASAPARFENASARPFHWSVRREIWENRTTWMVPLAVAALVLFSNFVRMFHLSRRMSALALLDAEKQRAGVMMPFSMAASVLLLTGFLLAMFYCVEALHGERRDRSILFWKSMPVSDRTTVLSKAFIPFVFLPLYCCVLALLVQFCILMMSTLALLGDRAGLALLWTRQPLIQMTFVMFYGVTAHVLWFAPIYGWLLVVSAWARRMPLLWAILPFFTLGVLERMTMGTTYVGSLLKYRVVGAMSEAFATGAAMKPVSRLMQLDPIRFLCSSGLWLGLLFAAVCLVIAVRLRRDREPI
jgi:ABC-2 type transport system permease protein